MLKVYRVKKALEPATTTLEAVRTLTSAEEREYRRACKHLHSFSRSQDLMALLEANFKEFEQAVTEFPEVAKNTRRGALNQDPGQARLLQRLAVNFLTATRLYLDHRQTFLTREYGTASPVLDAFNDARRRLHQDELPYRFVYELRNYVAHCGMPLQEIVSELKLVVQNGLETTETLCHVGFNRDALLSNCDNWRHSRQFIEAQPERFDALPIFEQVTRMFWTIDTAIVGALMPALWKDAKVVVSLMREGTNDDGFGQIASIDPKVGPDGQFQVSLIAPPFGILQWMKLITLLPGPPGMRIEEKNLAVSAPPNVT